MQHLRLRIAYAVTLLPTGGIAFVKHTCRCLVRSARVNSGSDFDILGLFSVESCSLVMLCTVKVLLQHDKIENEN